MLHPPPPPPLSPKTENQVFVSQKGEVAKKRGLRTPKKIPSLSIPAKMETTHTHIYIYIYILASWLVWIIIKRLFSVFVVASQHQGDSNDDDDNSLVVLVVVVLVVVVLVVVVLVVVVVVLVQLVEQRVVKVV